jgi:hypothetical protein
VRMGMREKQQEGHIDFESLEQWIRASMHGVGSILLRQLVNADGGDYRGRTMRGEQGQVYEFMGYREKQIRTILGAIRVKRAYYYATGSMRGVCPKDKAFDIEGTSFSPGLRRIMSRTGASRSFADAQEDIKELAGVEVTAKEIERTCHELGASAEVFSQTQDVTGKPAAIETSGEEIGNMYICMDGTGVPVVKNEVANRAGKGEQGQAKTREAKLGCIFTQRRVNEQGYAVRDEGSSSYVGAIETAEAFGPRMYAEAQRRRIQDAEKVCVIGDGAPWIWNIADEYFYGAVQIVDLYHAREHYGNIAKAIFEDTKDALDRWSAERQRELDAGLVADVMKAIKQVMPRSGHKRELCEKEIGYFEKNKQRMRYGDFRKQGLFVGSGVVEAGCRSVIGQRLKQSGMHWTVNGANSIIALRCCLFSNRWEDFWEYRAAA